MARPTFFVRRGDRLIARLKHMFYAWRFADQVGGRVVMMWPPLTPFWRQFDGDDYSPSLIFDLREFYAAGGGDDLLFLETRAGFPPGFRSLRDPEFAAMRPNRFEKSYFVDNPAIFHEQFALMFSFSDEPRTQEHAHTTLRRLYDRLPHDPAIVRAQRVAREKIGADDYVGLHVRRGDVTEMLRLDLPKLAEGALPADRLALLLGHYVCRTALDEFYYPEIERAISAKRRIVYFSDSPETMADFAKKFGRHNFVDGASFRMRIPCQKAFLDFNMLIGARTVVSTGSNYASFASTLSNGEHVNVAVAGSLERMQEHLYDEYLKGTSLDDSQRRMLDDELERQYARRAGMKPAQAEESLPPPIAPGSSESLELAGDGPRGGLWDEVGARLTSSTRAVRSWLRGSRRSTGPEATPDS